METQCPFIYAQFRCDETISKIKPIDLRIPCYKENCPSQMWDALVCINPSAPEGSKQFIGGHCKVIVNICENCKDLSKCKKSGSSKDICRQQRIDTIFRENKEPKQQSPPTTIYVKSAAAHDHENV